MHPSLRDQGSEQHHPRAEGRACALLAFACKATRHLLLLQRGGTRLELRRLLGAKRRVESCTQLRNPSRPESMAGAWVADRFLFQACGCREVGFLQVHRRRRLRQTVWIVER